MWSETQTVPFYISTDTSLPNTLLTHLPVRLTGPQCDIHIYLRRIDFFKCGTGTVYITDPFNPIDNLSRRTSSSNVLELFPIRVHEDVYDTGVG